MPSLFTPAIPAEVNIVVSNRSAAQLLGSQFRNPWRIRVWPKGAVAPILIDELAERAGFGPIIDWDVENPDFGRLVSGTVLRVDARAAARPEAPPLTDADLKGWWSQYAIQEGPRNPGCPEPICGELQPDSDRLCGAACVLWMIA